MMQHYVQTFETSERLRDVLAWALVVGRLTDEEVESVEASVSAEAVERRRQLERMAQYERWLVEVKLQLGKERAQRDRDRAKRDESYFRWWEWLCELELAGRIGEALSFEEWAEGNRLSAVEDSAWDAGSTPARSTTPKELPWR